LTFMCGSTCIGRLSAHHQERTTALGASGFTVGAWRLERCWSWSAKLLMMGGEAPETRWATHKRQVINLWNCCTLLVDLFESYDDARTCGMSKVQYHVCSYMHQYKQFWTYKNAYTDVRMYNTILYHTCTYDRLPEDESSVLKHVEDIIN